MKFQSIEERMRGRQAQAIQHPPAGLIEFGYKVVTLPDYESRRIPKSLWVYYSTGYSPQEVEYEVGQWAYPREGSGPLALFGTYDAARKFLHDTRVDFVKHVNHVIFACEYVRSEVYALWACNYFGNVGEKWASSLPEGSLTAEAIRLLYSL